MLSNYHTHTVYCDGHDTPTEMAEAAYQMGLDTLGFSGHSYTHFDTAWCMSQENTIRYQNEIQHLKSLYTGRMDILLGIEQDFYSEEKTDEYDYVIGSVHYLYRNGEYLPVDESKDQQLQTIDQYYGGDACAYAEDYYRTVAAVYEKTNCRIIGHFDLLTKFNEKNDVFDTENPRYVRAALNALDTLAKVPAVFELNTGAMSRGYRKFPYPERWILNWLRDHHCPVLFSSDCHDRKDLLFGYDACKADISCDKLCL